MKKTIELSVVIPVTERVENTIDIFSEYKRGIEATGLHYEIIYVLDGNFPNIFNALKKLIESGERISVVRLAKWFGEAVALNAGFQQANGRIILTLPAYRQIDPDEIPRLVQALDKSDMILARRWPRRDSWLNRLQGSIFNFFLRKISGLHLHDAGCGVRSFKRRVLDEVYIYGDLHRFFPIMAYRQGFKVIEINVSQSEYDTFHRIYPAGLYIRRLLDLFTIFFLIKFTKKPLRFFGLLGLGVFSIGLLVTLYIVAERIFFGIDMSTRSALILSSLLIVLGVQILAMGLIGEIIIFAHAKEIKEYTIEEVVN